MGTNLDLDFAQKVAAVIVFILFSGASLLSYVISRGDEEED